MQVINLSFAGIYSNSNNLNDQTINGGLLKANNIVIDQPNVAKSRRGQKKYNTYTETENGEEVSKPIRSMATYRSTLLAFTDDSLLVDNNGTYTVLSSNVESPLPSKKFHYVGSNRNFYFCDKSGVLKLDSLSSTPKLAGVPQALAITSIDAIAGLGSAIPNNSRVAYRVLFGYKDKNNNLILGVPSDRRIYTNTSGNTVNVTVECPVPDGIDNNYFCQLYRSTAVANTVTPDDELQLVGELPVNGTKVTFDDVTPESLLGAFLYTNETQEGITQANYQPPKCMDVALYKNCVFYANTKSISTYSSNLLGVSTTVIDPNDPSTVIDNNIQPGDTFTIGNEIFNAVLTYTDVDSDTVPDDPEHEFIVSSSLDPSTAIEETVKSLIQAININPNCECYAFYSSTDTDLPGSFTLQARDISADEIAVSTSKPNAFNPAISSAKTVSEEHKNRVYFSKPQQPEAVPLLNYIDVGSANYEIKRIVALRDSLFVFKSDGIYRIYGESASTFSCKLFDGTTSVIATETTVAFNNMVYAVSDQGIITVSETGVQIISMPIENDLFELTEFANFATLSFSVAYASDRKYILFVPSRPEDTTCTQAFIYNSYTQTFVRWDMSRSCGIVRPNEEKQGELFLGTTDGITYIERKTFTIDDYCDDEYDVRIVEAHPYRVSVRTLPSEVKVGFTIRQGRLSSIVEKIMERIVMTPDPGDSYTVFDLTLSNNSLYNPYNAEIEHGADTIDITILKSVAYSVTLFEIPSDIEVGDTLKQGALSSTITAIDTVHNTLTLSNDKIYDIPDNATLYTPIKKSIEWFPITCNNPSFYKHFREITFMFLEAQFKNLSFSVYSDSSPDTESTELVATSLGAWGYGGWGNLPWGGGVGGRQAIRSYIPLEKSRCRWLDLSLTNNQAFNQFAVSGISLMYSLVSERDTR